MTSMLLRLSIPLAHRREREMPPPMPLLRSRGRCFAALLPPRRVLGQFASPYFVTPSPATLSVQKVRWAKRAPSCLVWLATCPSTEGHIDPFPRELLLGSSGLDLPGHHVRVGRVPV